MVRKIYIIPLLGKGLWGPIYGNIALNADMNTIMEQNSATIRKPRDWALRFDRSFADQFIGKKIFDDQWKFISIKVVKGGVGICLQADQIHGVDAISGGTITCNGVTEMIENCLEELCWIF